MKRIFEYAIALGVVGLLALVMMLVAGIFTNTTPEVGQVYVKNSETQITPVSSEIYVTQGKTVAEKKRLVPEEISASLPVLKMDDALTVLYEGGSDNGGFYFTIYRENMDIYTEKKNTFTAPYRPGIYVICLELYWGSPSDNIGMEYYFKLEVTGT